MKVLVVMTARLVGGAELYVERLTRALAQDCAFTVAAASHPALEDLRAHLGRWATVRAFPFDQARALPGLAPILRALADQQDVVHLVSNHPASRLGIGLAFALGGRRVPLICVEQRATPVADVQVPRWLAPALPTLFRWSRRGAARVVAVSRQSAACLTQDYGLPPGRIDVIYNGTDLDALRSAPASTLRQELGLTAAQPVVVTAARLAPNKGQRYLVEAAPAILARHPHAHFILAGDTDDGGAVARQIAAAGLDAHFSLLGHRPDLANVLTAGDVFVLPSLAEGFALALVDALACGLPVVATAVGGAPEVIQPGRTGWLVPPADAPALAQALNAALALPPAERARWRAAAQATAAQFSTPHMAAQTLALYRRVSAAPTSS